MLISHAATISKNQPTKRNINLKYGVPLQTLYARFFPPASLFACIRTLPFVALLLLYRTPPTDHSKDTGRNELISLASPTKHALHGKIHLSPSSQFFRILYNNCPSGQNLPQTVNTALDKTHQEAPPLRPPSRQECGMMLTAGAPRHGV